MSTVASPVDVDTFKQVLSKVRSDTSGVHRKAWFIAGHVNNNPNEIDIVGEDTSPEANLDDFRASLKGDQVMYGLVRLTSTLDMSTTVKFVYVHWVGDSVPFAKRGRYGVVRGSVEQYFNPYHLLIETGNSDDLTEAALVSKLDESSGTKSKIVEGSLEGRQERGFLQHMQVTKQPHKESARSVAPEGALVNVSPELQEAIGEVRSDKSPVTWVLAGFQDGNVKAPLIVCGRGCGSIDELRAQLDDEQVMYGLYRTGDLIDAIVTVKFVYIYWIGENVKPLTKGKVSAYAGPIEKVFSPAHASLSFSSRNDINEDIINDKVTSGSGSKSFVMK